jgi:HipA-like protein
MPLKTILQIFRDWKERAGQTEPASLREDVRFRLQLGDLEIGELMSRGGFWVFRYSDAFQKQDAVRTLVQFPDKDKVYKSDDLWPFFSLRIPGLRQGSVQEVIAKEHIDPSDEAALLRRFGRKTVANPFQLIEVEDTSDFEPVVAH